MVEPLPGAEVAPTAGAAPLVRLEGIHKWFGNLHVLKGVDLSMQQRDVVVVIGPSALAIYRTFSKL